MYFEEKIINGILCWRDTPTGEWQQYSAAEISAKYEQVQLRLAQKKVEAPETIDNTTKVQICPKCGNKMVLNNEDRLYCVGWPWCTGSGKL